MGIIQDLYDQAESFEAGFTHSKDKDWQKTYEKLQSAKEDLESDLTDNQKRKLEKMQELQVSANSIELDRMFNYAFKIGCMLIIDIYKE